MQVDPDRLVEWAEVRGDLAVACESLGDAVGTTSVTASYADALADAEEVVAALTQALGLGVIGLLDAAHDAVEADDTVASEITRATGSFQQGGFGPGPSHGRGR